MSLSHFCQVVRSILRFFFWLENVRESGGQWRLSGGFAPIVPAQGALAAGLGREAAPSLPVQGIMQLLEIWKAASCKSLHVFIKEKQASFVSAIWSFITELCVGDLMVDPESVWGYSPVRQCLVWIHSDNSRLVPKLAASFQVRKCPLWLSERSQMAHGMEIFTLFVRQTHLIISNL